MAKGLMAWEAYPEVKVQVRDVVRVVGLVALRGSVFGKNSFYRAPGVNRHRRPVPGAHSSGSPRESQAKFRGGAVWGLKNVLWVPGPRCQYSGLIRFIGKPGVEEQGVLGVSIRGKFVLSTNLGYKRSGVAMWLNVVLTNGFPKASQSLDMGPCASCGYCCLLCPTWAQYSGKIHFIEPQGGKWAQEACAGCPKQRYATGEAGKGQGRDRVGIVQGSCGYRARGLSIR